MTTRVVRTVLVYGTIIASSLIVGFISMEFCNQILGPTLRLRKADWPQAELHIAASAALKFEKEYGRLPASLRELRGKGASVYLPQDLDLPGVLYFRDGTDQPRLSWRDDVDNDAAYCSLDSAIRERC